MKLTKRQPEDESEKGLAAMGLRQREVRVPLVIRREGWGQYGHMRD